ncbi:hypothetical protein AMTR_s00012p00158080 [Amborella trichopoda]|uniref:CCHC-type domain-containing protein n=1 Tax=Amborella trichopoda TaxID=13333 RepID=W1PD15_AMBTC|nr:hypothetical protein AMTR_s00012p00158080 [Amborella trichopoda]
MSPHLTLVSQMTPLVTVHNPPHVQAKGWPRTPRMKTASEKKVPGTRKCVVCSQGGHDKRNCVVMKLSLTGGNVPGGVMGSQHSEAVDGCGVRRSKRKVLKG